MYKHYLASSHSDESHILLSTYTLLRLALLLPRSLPPTCPVIPTPLPTTHPLVLQHDILHTTHIMFWLPHVRQPGSPSSLRLPLHHLDTLHIRTVDLVPHLDSDSRQLIPQQDAGLDTSASNVDTYSRKRIARLQPYEQNVADVGSFRVGFGEEVRAGAGGVEDGDLRGVEVVYGFFEFGGGSRRRWIGFDFADGWEEFVSKWGYLDKMRSSINELGSMYLGLHLELVAGFERPVSSDGPALVSPGNMNRQSLIKAIRGSECCSKNAKLSLSRRTFTNSAVCRRNDAVPDFEPTPSAELDLLLRQYRSKLFLPAHLSEYDKRIIYSPKKSKSLLNDPKNVEIGGEEFRLEYIDRLVDEPQKRAGLRKVLNLMKETKHWNNLPRFLEGLKDCKRPLEKDQLQQMIGKAALANRIDIVIECARRVTDTGFRLNEPAVVKSVMWGLHVKAAQSNWAAKETEQALRLGEMVAKMLEDKQHAGGPIAGDDDVRRLPEVIGILLELAAVRASKHLEGKDADGKVATYAARIVDMPTKQLTIDEKSTDKPLENAINQWLREAVPVIHGMKEALRLLDPDTRPRHRLREMLPPLEKQAKEYAAQIHGSEAERWGLKAYNDLIASA
ncbi:hypothetical protein CJF31_00009487 [Rutstroemia sp. NJR-2017a BVV2]|nr:hypothetical protein CJF31_00009487 [Rutstroemia sp. NJR-2017a BVV2]